MIPPFALATVPNVAPLGTFTFANTFTGLNANGTWTLHANDHATLDIGATCSWSLNFANVEMPLVTDLCDATPTVTFSDVTTAIPGACTQEYTISRTWTATDDCGNSSQCIQSILVDDSTAPVIACPSNVTIECSADPLPGIGGQASATATDNCDAMPLVTFTDVTTSLPNACTEDVLLQESGRQLMIAVMSPHVRKSSR